MTPHVAISASGGGAKGAYQVGVLEYMAERLGAPIDSQFGRFVTYSVNCWHKLERTEQVWRRLPPWRYIPPVGNSGHVGDSAPLRLLLDELLPGTAHDLVMQGVPVTMPAWDMESGRLVWLESKSSKDKADYISMGMASSSFPLAFPPEIRKEGMLSDGGIAAIHGIEASIRRGAERILAISCRNPKQPERASRSDLDNIFKAAFRFLDGMENEICFNDLQLVELWNLLVEAKHPRAANKRLITLDHIAPSEPLGSPLDFSSSLTEKRKAVGRKDAKAYFDKNPDALLAYRDGFDSGDGCSVGAILMLGLGIQSQKRSSP
jgi:predicted acylesterase/phospholipase RssA